MVLTRKWLNGLRLNYEDSLYVNTISYKGIGKII